MTETPRKVRIMKQTKYNGTSLMKMLGSIVISFAMLFTFARSITAQQMDTMKGMRAEIPDGADRMVITQETIYPGEAYINALNYFERKGFMVMTSEDTTDESALNELVDSEPLAFEVKKQVSDSMALKYTINVQDRTQGSSLIAAVKWRCASV